MKLVHGRFLSNPFQFIIHSTSVIRRYGVWFSLLRASWRMYQCFSQHCSLTHRREYAGTLRTMYTFSRIVIGYKTKWTNNKLQQLVCPRVLYHLISVKQVRSCVRILECRWSQSLGNSEEKCICDVVSRSWKLDSQEGHETLRKCQ
jgi:hypothetical protein